MVRRFGAIRFIAGLLRLLGVAQIVLGIFAAVFAFSNYHLGIDAIMVGVGFTIIGFAVSLVISGILFLAFGELLHVLLAIEENTRSRA